MMGDGPDAYASAIEMASAVKAGRVGALELVERHLHRIARIDPCLNSIVVKDFDRARREARALDRDRTLLADSPLRGVPVTIKESIDVEGLPSTAGVPDRKGHAADRDARAVARLRSAGAIVIGKTNVCTWLADFNSDNPVYGRTNNPWNLDRTSGGSSGGSASLAAGLCALDLGSDLGGSIRVPTAFCGLFGHRPSDSVVPNSGHFPGSSRPNAAAVMAVQGPMGRSAFDLELALDVIGGADVGMDAGWKLSFPPARHERLEGFRVGVLPPMDWVPVDRDIWNALERIAAELRSLGAEVRELLPPGLEDLRAYYALFRSMMGVMVSPRWPAEHRARTVADKLARQDEFQHAEARGLCASSADYFLWHERREAYRAAWRDFFRDWDVLLTPATLCTAFGHTTVPTADRRLHINGREVEFDYMSFYPGLATLCGQPATTFPARVDSGGLPIGIQAIGPFLEDRTPLRFAQLIEKKSHPFQPPPMYDARLT